MSYRETQTISSVSRGVEINKVLRNTYFLLGMTLAVSAIAAVFAMALNISPMASLVCMIAGFVLLFVVNKQADKASGIIWIFAFTALLGASLGPMLNYYVGLANGPSLIMQALAGTAVIFFSLSAYALTTRKDFSFMGGFLFVGLIVVLLAVLANIFLQIPALSLAISSAVILIMSGLILFDTSRIIHGGETNYIRATVALYLNIFNIFVHLLSLLGVLNND
ncbi:MAG: Bax inhibitor-1/YccA family protein [Alkalimonas sp.]|uniref:Bax inhibitor-1/YccA family protein n=1 Tax=Alkalimonas delamerensis TaxID=265981 RepID=A0ABT9GPJ7_9GAMM|nr:Bax inhibitor-1/YccA family protein [Alkalimonas delamerensis]MCC5851596.1 Bax inhibitor-1/YccA family protein [Alkalimonas sp.]MDP4528887.1 Bax inhibitor-1/YccA family protein [Alkalimonas delamerensis]